MARLILLNGPPAIGKSAVAQRFVDDNPLALNLDIDELRRWLGRWQEHDGSKALARSLAKVLARAHLEVGHDVVVPQLLLREEVIEDLRDLATDAGASFVEIVLLGRSSESLERFHRRRAELARRREVHPEALVESERIEEAIAFSDERLRAMAKARPSLRAIETDDQDVDAVYQAVVAALRDYDQLFGSTS